MSQGTVELRDAKRIRELTSDFLTRNEHFLAGSRLDAPLNEHRHGGGALMYAFGADHPAIESYIGSQQLVAPGFTLPSGFAYWSATSNGGPYGTFDGSTRALYISDAPWQEAVGNTLLVWHWTYLNTLAATSTISSKYDFGINARSWVLFYQAATAFRWFTNATGLGAGDVTLNSSYTVAANTWYFTAGFYQPSTLMRIYVGAATDPALTIDSLVAGVPASLHNGAAPLGIGTIFNTAPTLVNSMDGRIGRGGARIATPVTNIDAFVNQLFAETQSKYQ